jgi:hypothetical protein
LRKNQFNSYNPGANLAGTYNFSGDITNVNHTANNPVNSMADFMLGQVKSGSYQIPQPMSGRRNSNTGVFIQDDWRILPHVLPPWILTRVNCWWREGTHPRA